MRAGRRVRGLETEYGLHLELQTADPTSPLLSDPRMAGLSSGSASLGHRWRRVGVDEAARLLFRPITTTSATTNVFLRNGGRLYLDVGSHPEYATAECDQIDDLVAHDRAGDGVVNRLADRALELVAEDAQVARVRLMKNNLDAHGNSYGSHENYQVSRELTLRGWAAALTPFLVVRQLLCGAGTWVRPRQGVAGQGEHGQTRERGQTREHGQAGEFWFSQRAAHMWDPVSSTTTRSRPMINTRDEPHADPARFRRLHIIVGDSNLAQPTLRLRLGATELVLRAIEQGHRFERWQLADTGTAIRDTAKDLTGRASLALAGGGVTTPLEMLTDVLERVSSLGEGEPWAEATIELWTRVLVAVDSGDWRPIQTEIDWAIKHRLLTADADRRGQWDPLRLAQLDLAFHDLRPGQGIFGRLEAGGQVATVLDPAQISRAQHEPPATTRARLRSRLLTAAQQHQRSYTVDWMSFQVRDLDDGALLLPDPLVSADDRVDELIARMSREPRRTRSTSFTIG